MNDRALKQIELQAAAIKLEADAQQIEIAPLVEQAANEKFDTADQAFKSRQARTGSNMITSGERIFAIEEAFDITVPFNANNPTESDFDISTVASIIAGIERLKAEQA